MRTITFEELQRLHNPEFDSILTEDHHIFTPMSSSKPPMTPVTHDINPMNQSDSYFSNFALFPPKHSNVHHTGMTAGGANLDLQSVDKVRIPALNLETSTPPKQEIIVEEECQAESILESPHFYEKGYTRLAEIKNRIEYIRFKK